MTARPPPCVGPLLGLAAALAVLLAVSTTIAPPPTRLVVDAPSLPVVRVRTVAPATAAAARPHGAGAPPPFRPASPPGTRSFAQVDRAAASPSLSVAAAAAAVGALAALWALWRGPSRRPDGPLVALATAAGEVTPAPDRTAAATAPPKDKSVPQADEWEVDFSSRPLLDNRGKRVWEIMVCDPRRTFEHSEYVPNNKVNSGTLKAVVEKLLDRKGARKPRVVRFFRGQMITIITKAFQDLGLKAVASRRCFTIMNWLDERLPTVYQRDPRFDANIGLSGALRGPIEAPPSRLPDALRGETWEFVELPLAAVQREAALLGKGTEFGASFDFEAAGVGDLPPDTPVPGVAVFSRRSKPLAGWTAGLELTAITSDEKQACLLLESGFSDKWYYGGWTDPKLASEGVAWEKAKQKCRGLHFLAVQQDDQSDVTDGFWVLLKREPPQV